MTRTEDFKVRSLIEKNAHSLSNRNRADFGYAFMANENEHSSSNQFRV